ncbi:MAG: beta strand repeat-containing protein [Candidatus Dormibacteria bacterium]
MACLEAGRFRALIALFAVAATLGNAGLFAPPALAASCTDEASCSSIAPAQTPSGTAAAPTADVKTMVTLTVTLQKVSGVPVPAAPVKLSKLSGPGSTDVHQGTSKATDSNTGTTFVDGTVVFQVDTSTAGNYVFQAQDTSNVSNPVVVTQTAAITFAAGPPTAANSVLATSSGSATADGTSAVTVTVTLADAYNNPTPGRTASLAETTGLPVTISAPSGVSDSGGNVSWTVTSSTSGQAQLVATDAGDQVSVGPAAVTFVAGPPSLSTSGVTAAPSSLTANGTSASTVTVVLKDAHGNAENGKTVALEQVSGGTSSISPKPGVTDASGAVSFSVTATVAGSDAFRVNDTSDGFILTQQVSITFTPGLVSASRSTVSLQPGSVTADGTSAVISVALKDAEGNPVSGKTVAVSKLSGPGTPGVSRPATTNAGGTASFSVASFTAGVDDFGVSDASDGLTVGKVTETFTPGPVSGAASTVTVTPSTQVADGTASSAVTLTLLDAFGNAVAGKSVSLAQTAGPRVSLTGGGAATDANGEATYGVNSINLGQATLQATDVTDSVVVQQTGQVTFVVGGQYHPLAPSRIVDTRTDGGRHAPLGPAGTVAVPIAGHGGIPTTGASAVVLNVTVTGTTALSYLTVYPSGIPRPTASNLNWLPGQTVPNLVTVAVGGDGAVALYNNAGSADLVLDVEGWYGRVSDGSTSGFFGPLAPERLLDTRDGTGLNRSQPLNPGETLTLRVAGAGSVPTKGVEAAVLNVTVTNTAAWGFLTVFPAGAQVPVASNLNFVAGQTVANRVMVPLSADGSVSIYNFKGGRSADVVVDINGWFTDASAPAAGGGYSPLAPARILDTRGSGGDIPSALGPDSTGALMVAGHGGVPAMTAPLPPTGVVLNVTVTNPSAWSFLTIFPSDGTLPVASDLNWTGGQTVANLVVVGVGSDGRIDIHNLAGKADVVVDVEGWFN